MASYDHKEVLYGIYDDEQPLIAAVKKAREQHLDIMDVFSPFPIHGLDPVLGLSESRLHIAGFIFGALGTLTAVGFMTWVHTRDWPIIFGGKPYWSFPAFVPITFELTVLFASIGMVVAFYTVCGLAPGVTNPSLDDRLSDDKFAISFQTNGYSSEEIENIKAFFRSTGASEINSKLI